MKTLITGGSGLLGKELIKLYPNALAPSRQEMDITKKDQILSSLRKYKPSLIIHLAAATSVKECNQNKKWAWKTNVVGTQNLIDICKEMYLKDTKIILMSTPCIFNGEVNKEYSEDDIPDPDSYYGFTKSIQETIVKNYTYSYLIIRSNFVPRKKWPFPKAFTDRYSYYLFADVLAIEMKKLINSNREGIFHIVGDKLMSMFDVAKINNPSVKPLTLKEYYTKNPKSAKLTKYMKLQSKRLSEVPFR